jgi:alkanesulfonate monooxygenase SsuD/methylene tetrahydromethanopterin reductase-like flavin-dependent oxidoreductase (luciferase family)
MIHMAHYFRHPALTAKMAATLDQLSGGRLIHFLDAGYQKREYVNYGLFGGRRWRTGSSTSSRRPS